MTDDEYRQAASALRDAIALHGEFRLLFRLQDVSLQSFLNALDERFKFVQEHHEDIDRVAIVSDDNITDWLSRLVDRVAPVETRHFSRDDEQLAWTWLE